MKTLDNVNKWAAAAVLLILFDNVNADTIVETTGTTGTENAATSEITIGAHVDEIYGIKGTKYKSDAPNSNGTYSAGKVGTLTINYISNAPGRIHVAPREDKFARNGLTNDENRVSYHLQKDGTSVAPGVEFVSDYLREVSASTEYTVDVHADQNITFGDRYTGTVVVSFIPESAAP